MKDAFVASAVRTPVGKAPNGRLRATRPDDMAALVIAEALRRVPALDPAEIDDVILGCAMPEAEQGLNVARIASLRAGIPVSASAMTINRFCSSGLQAIALAAERIMVGAANVIVAGGTESMSLVPMGGHKIAPNPTLVDDYPDVYLTTGLVAENHARESGITREMQDAFALRSHQRAVAAIDAGRFADELVAVGVRPQPQMRIHDEVRPQADAVVEDEGPRRDTSMEALAKLQTGVSRERHGHRRQLVADERRRVGRRRDERRPGPRARRRAAWTLRRLHHRRRGARTLRHRSRPRDPEDSESHRADARSTRPRSS